MVNYRFFIALVAILGVFFVTLLTKRSHIESQKLSHVKVYECLEVGNDLAALKKHMQAHQEFIDFFVVLEDAKEPDGRLAYEQRKGEFKDFHNKVIYLVTSPLAANNLKAVNETYIKNQYLKALDKCMEEDIILFSNAKSKIRPQDLKKGVQWLKKHPNQVIKLRAKSIENKKDKMEIRAAIFAHVKEALPASIENKSKLKAQKISWQSAFFPV